LIKKDYVYFVVDGKFEGVGGNGGGGGNQNTVHLFAGNFKPLPVTLQDKALIFLAKVGAVGVKDEFDGKLTKQTGSIGNHADFFSKTGISVTPDGSIFP
jgi:hypothetical protein